ncbi:MAG TPA: MMPL family transporter, partial [Pirellulales bacterium]|nr:MMPL family transporter [Pirellulales bacterium]
QKRLESSPFNLSAEEAKTRLAGTSISRDGETTSVIVKLTEEGDANRRKTVDVLRQIATNDLKLEESQIHMAGDAVTNAEVDIASQDAIQSLVLFSIIIALACSYLSLRSLGLVIALFLSAFYSSFFPESLLYYSGGNMNLILVVMPVLVYVLSLSAGVHLVNYYHDALREAPESEAPLIAIKHGWLPCAMAAGTTAIGLGSLCVSPIRPVKDFGFYSAFGIAGSLAFIFLLLPSLLILLQKLPLGARKYLLPTATNQQTTAAPPLFEKEMAAFGGYVVDHKVAMSGACLVILVVLGWGACFIKTSVRPARFFDHDSRMLKDYRWLTAPERFGSQVPIELVVRFDNQKEPLNTLQQLELVSDMHKDLLKNRSDLVDSAVSAATFAPDLSEAKSRNRRFATNKRLAASRPAYHDMHFYSYKLPEGQPDKIDWETAQPAVEYWRINARIKRTEEEYDVITEKIVEYVNDLLAARRESREKERSQLISDFDHQVAEAKKTLAKFEEEHAGDEEKLGLARTKFNNSMDFYAKNHEAQLVSLKDDTASVEMSYTGMVPLFHEAQNQLLNGLFNSFMVAFVLIAVVMICWFRSVLAGLITMLPNVFPAAVIFGYMGWRGLIVDIGSMMTASVAMGIAVDDTVHFLTWFRRGQLDGLSRRDALVEAFQRCARAMTQTTMIAGFGLLVFSLSNFQPVAQFGLLMFVLLAAALIGDLVFLPALLATSAGKLFEPKTRAGAPELATRQPVA